MRVNGQSGGGNRIVPEATALRMVRTKLRLLRSFLAVSLSAALAISLGVVGGALPAAADTAPAAGVPVTVSADGLPTAQINGVAWTQVIIGNTVYVGGNFTEARPAGAAPGTGGVVRNNILAYNLTTGALLPFAPSFNGEVTALAASPDGTRLYVGGAFTSINGSTVWRVVALNPTSGNLITSFLPRMSASVRAIVATPTTVYLGGLFNAVGSVSRDRLAAVSASNGALLPWNPLAVGGRVNALALSPDGASMVVGGAFTSLNGSTNPGFGLGKVDTNLGANLPFQINNVVRNGGTNGSITTLASDGTNVYGGGYTFGRTSTLEGVFSVNWSDDSTKWIEDCHGDTYSVFPMDDVVYLAGHAHYCGNVGGFPQAEPWEFQRGLAFSKAATGVLTQETHGYTNYAGTPAPSLQNWFPYMNSGTITGQDQGPWTVTGNSDYVVMAGEFTIVNNQQQQGLVRFAKSNIAPDLRGPRVDGLNFNPTLSTPAAGQVRVRWQANWDQDNENLTYEVRRNGAVIATIDQASTFWNRPGMTFLDTGLVPGQSYGYRIFAIDPFGNDARSETINITVAGSVTPPGSYAQSVLADEPNNYWRLGDPSGTAGVDLAGKDDLLFRPGVTLGAPGAIGGETDTAATFNGTLDGIAVDRTLDFRPQVFSQEAWFKTGSITGGQIFGYGNTQTTVSTDFDRVLYMSNLGRLFFGVRPNGVTRQTVSSVASYNDNQWHHVVATLGSNGMQLFVDGVLVGSRTDVTSAWQFDGFWRIGGDNLGSWTNRPTNRYFNGQLDDVAIYPSVLPLSRIQAHYVASGRNVNAPPAPPVAAFTSTTEGLTASVDGTTSSDANGPITDYAWNFGDGGTGSGVTAQHVYAAGGTYDVTLTVTDNTGLTNSVTHPVTVTAPPPNQVPVADFSFTASNLAAAFDGSASADADGTIAGYAWDFGDATSATGATANHTYAAEGTYAVKLTVTDDDGATGTVTKNVTVTAPPANTVLAADAFGRTSTGGWGTADTGGAWTITSGTSSFAVNNGSGAVSLGAGQSRMALLKSVSTAANDSRVTVSADKPSTGGGWFASLLGRRLADDAANTDYRAKIKVASNGVVTLYLTRVVSGTETTLAQVNVAGLTVAANDPVVLRLRLEGTSPTSLTAKVWRASAAEPAAWQLTASDNTAGLQVAGGTGLVSYLSASATNAPVTLRYDNLNVTAGGAPVANAAPIAAFTSTTSGLTANLNAGTSSDSDGTITNYAWDFGDGTTGSGATPSHAYAAANTYQVTLTVTDDDGATNAVTQPVTVAAPPPPGVLAADAFGRTVASGWGSADNGGAWTVGGGSYNVGNGVGTMLLGAPNAGPWAGLQAVSATDTDVRVKVSQDKIATGGGSFVGVIGRKVGTGNEYRAKLRIFANGTTSLYLTRLSAGAETTLQSISIPGLTLVANDQVQIRLQVTGTNPTTLRAKVWRDGATEPADWQLTATDTTAALQAAGYVGLMSYLWGTATNAPVAVRFDDFAVTTP